MAWWLGGGPGARGVVPPPVLPGPPQGGRPVLPGGLAGARRVEAPRARALPGVRPLRRARPQPAPGGARQSRGRRQVPPFTRMKPPAHLPRDLPLCQLDRGAQQDDAHHRDKDVEQRVGGGPQVGQQAVEEAPARVDERPLRRQRLFLWSGGGFGFGEGRGRLVSARLRACDEAGRPAGGRRARDIQRRRTCLARCCARGDAAEVCARVWLVLCLTVSSGRCHASGLSMCSMNRCQHSAQRRSRCETRFPSLCGSNPLPLVPASAWSRFFASLKPISSGFAPHNGSPDAHAHKSGCGARFIGCVVYRYAASRPEESLHGAVKLCTMHMRPAQHSGRRHCAQSPLGRASSRPCCTPL